MHLLNTVSVVLGLLFAESAQSEDIRHCSLLGPDVPIPRDVSSTCAFQNATVFMKKAISAAINKGETEYGALDASATSFSLDIFSLHEDDGLFTYHYDAPGLAGSTDGVKKIDSDSIYRLGSISKLLTVYAFLATVGDVSFNEPITKYIPELAAYAAEHAADDDQVDFIDWDSVTVGGLASQLSGIPRETAGSPSTDVLLKYSFPPHVPFPVYPPVPGNITDHDCPNVYGVPCTRAAAIGSINFQHPAVAPFSGPVYSNVAYSLLGMALEQMTNHSLPDLFTSELTRPLQLNSTYFSDAPVSQGVIPISDSDALYSTDLMIGGAAGGYYSSINDMRKIGKSILNSTLLSPSQTRRWLKPQTFTANDQALVGAPWEIYKAPLTEKSVWMYTKSGDVGTYSTNFILLPDYGIGFTVLAAGADPHRVKTTISDIIAAIGVPAFEKAAKEDASKVYAGTYHRLGANDTLTLTVDDHPGLLISQWLINSTDVVAGFREAGDVIRLNPSGLQSKSGERLGFKAVRNVASVPEGAFVANCVDWFSVSSIVLGGVALDEMVITLSDDKKKAVTVDARGFRVSYSR